MESYHNIGAVVKSRIIKGDVISPVHIDKVIIRSGTDTDKPKQIYFGDRHPVSNFTGRSNELERLTDAMKQSLNTPTTKSFQIVVSGLGGIGKTEFVRKFIHENRSTYQNIIWIESESNESISHSFKTLATNILHIPAIDVDGKVKDMKVLIEQVLQKCNKSRTLFVYDNVESIESMTLMLTATTSREKLHIIITSRIQEWDEIEVTHLKVWTLDEAKEFVGTVLDGDDPDDDKMVLVEKLQCFPLALRQATAYIKSQRKSRDFMIREYTKKLEQHAKELLDSKIFQKSPTNLYQNTTFTTWRITIETIERDEASGPLAVKILKIIAYFAPDNIRRDYFVHMCDYQHPTNAELMAAVDLLINYSMVDGQEKQSVLSIHRLVQEVMKATLRETLQEKPILQEALKVIFELEKESKMITYASYYHAIAVFLSTLEHIDLVREFEVLPNYIMRNLLQSSKYNLAKDFGNEILAPLNNILGEDHTEALKINQNTAFSYRELGNYSRALAILQEVLVIRKRFQNEDHPDILLVNTSMGCSYRELGNHLKALQIFQHVFEKQTNILGEDHPHTLVSMSNIADAYRQLGKHSEALEMFEQVFMKRTKILGEYHPETLKSKSRIAFTYGVLGKYVEALQAQQEIFAKLKDVLGENHPDTLKCQSNIGYSHSVLGNYSEALKVQQEIFEKRKRILGDDHPDTLAVKCGIATSYSVLGNHSESLRIQQEVYEQRRSILGEDNPNTLLSKSYMAYSYEQLGLHLEALKFFEEVFDRRRIILGDDHPDTIRSKSRLAFSFVELGDHTKALQMFEEVFEQRGKVLGGDHLDTVKTKWNVGFCYCSLGNHLQAMQILQELFEKLKLILGDDHHDTLKTKSDIALTYIQMGNLSQALETHQEVFEKLKHILGEDHQNSLIVKSNIAHLYKESGNHSKALQLFEEVFEKRKNILGDAHIDSLVSKLNIAFSHSLVGNQPQALRIYREFSEEQKNNLKNHSQHRSGKSYLGPAYSELGNQCEILKFFREDCEKEDNRLSLFPYYFLFPFVVVVIAALIFVFRHNL